MCKHCKYSRRPCNELVMQSLGITTIQYRQEKYLSHLWWEFCVHVISETVHVIDLVITALHGMQTRSSDENVSVCPSNAWIVTKRKKNQSRFLYHTKDHLSRFSEKKNGCWATPFTWNFGSTGPRWSEIADFGQIIARSASAVRPSEKSSTTPNRKYVPTRFSTSLWWSSYVAPKSPKGGLRNAKRPFSL